jgi:hypothetical protein
MLVLVRAVFESALRLTAGLCTGASLILAVRDFRNFLSNGIAANKGSATMQSG